MNQFEEVEELAQGRESAARKRAKYEAACATVPLGHLCGVDVCRLWSKRPRKEWREHPGAEARRLVAEHGLPLMELGPGRWVVAHTIEGGER